MCGGLTGPTAGKRRKINQLDIKLSRKSRKELRLLTVKAPRVASTAEVSVVTSATKSESNSLGDPHLNRSVSDKGNNKCETSDRNLNSLTKVRNRRDEKWGLWMWSRNKAVTGISEKAISSNHNQIKIKWNFTVEIFICNFYWTLTWKPPLPKHWTHMWRDSQWSVFNVTNIYLQKKKIGMSWHLCTICNGEQVFSDDIFLYLSLWNNAVFTIEVCSYFSK